MTVAALAGGPVAVLLGVLAPGLGWSLRRGGMALRWMLPFVAAAGWFLVRLVLRACWGLLKLAPSLVLRTMRLAFGFAFPGQRGDGQQQA